MLTLLPRTSRALVANNHPHACKILQDHPGVRAISTTCVRYAEPPRKKRRIDPAVFKLRVERKIRKTEREIHKLEAEPRQLAPVLEYQLTNSDIKDLKSRPQHSYEDFGVTPAAILGARRLWSFYRAEQSRLEQASIARLQRSQETALRELKSLDLDLYNTTIAMDETQLIPYRSSHMRKETPPNPEYTAPDGHITDVTKKWVM